MRSTLLAVEAGLAVVVLIGTGLLVSSLSRAVNQHPGIDPTGVYALGLSLPQKEFYGVPERPMFCQQMQRQTRDIAGVQSVSAVSHLPLAGRDPGHEFLIEGAPDPGNDRPSSKYGVVCPNYFRTMDIPILQGEDFSDRHVAAAPQVVIVNDVFRRTYFSDAEIIGKRIRIANSGEPWLTIVGVVADVRHEGLTSEPRPHFYRPYAQSVWPHMSVVFRSQPEQPPPVANFRRALAVVTPDEPVGDAVAMTDVVRRSIGHLRFPLTLMLAFGCIATALTIVGVFGVAAQAVAQRRRELAIRTALGASQRSIYGLVIGQTMVPVLLGIVGGVVVARMGGQLIEGMLYGIAATHVATFVLTVVALSVIALAACLGPARRAARVDTMLVMRGD
jgi:putative ABC transport system permease protein